MDTQVQTINCKFFFPFTYKKKQFEALCDALTGQQFHFETLETLNGPQQKEMLDQFFYPFVQSKLFHPKPSIEFFNRYRKTTKIQGHLKTPADDIPFSISELNVFICPYNTAIVSVTITLSNLHVNTAVNFIDFFRQLTHPYAQLPSTIITVDHRQFQNSQQLLFDYCLPMIPPFMQQYLTNGYQGSLPFFEDERMYVCAFIGLHENGEPTNELLYRLLQLDGTDKEGNEIKSSTNKDYIDDYINKHSYNRWSPDLTILTTMQVQLVVATLPEEDLHSPLQHFETTVFYNFVLHYFYKIVLLKLTYEHSEIKWSTDKVIAESLSEEITTFSSKYYFPQVAVRSSGREISDHIRKHFRIKELFTDVNQSVNNLYRVLDDENNDRYNQLLFILTVFTVISGIYGMNLVIEDWKKPIVWSNLSTLTFYEMIAFLTAVIGIWISIILTVGAIARYIIQWIRKRKHQA